MREKKYYKIRADVFWMLVICVVAFVVAKNYGKIRLPKQVKNESNIVKNWQQTEETEPALLSKLEDNKQCYLCGSSDYSMMDYYRKFDTITYRKHTPNSISEPFTTVCTSIND